MGRILVIEDDPSIQELIAVNLETVGYAITVADSLRAARKSMEERDIDLALLDIMLPDGDGCQLLPELRNRGIAIIVITAKDSLKDKVRGLEGGADDYLTKPFEALELIARMRSVLRRYARDRRRHSFSGIELDADARVVLKNGQPIALRRREFDLLLCLAEHRGIALSREKLLELAWGYSYAGNTRTVDVHVQRVRGKLGVDAIKTVPGTGYRLEE